MRILLFFLVLVGLGSCTHHNRSKVVMKVDDEYAHVCMYVGEVRVGDRVVLYKEHCTGMLATEDEDQCVSTLGEGTVVELLNEHYSVVAVDPGVEFEQGVRVRRKHTFDGR